MSTVSNVVLGSERINTKVECRDFTVAPFVVKIQWFFSYTQDDSSDMGVGGRVLATLDQFALKAYDEKEQPELRVDGLSKSSTLLAILE